MLALEGQLLDELAGDDDVLRGELALGASTGPGGTVVPVLLGEFQRANPELSVALSISDTNRVIEQVAERELELGISRRRAALPRRCFRAFLPRRGDLSSSLPATPSRAGR